MTWFTDSELQGLCPDTEIVCGINGNVWSFITIIRLNRGSRAIGTDQILSPTTFRDNIDNFYKMNIIYI